MWLRRFAARKRKRGASLVMVLVSMTILTIMGTLFTTIAMRSYQYSYSRMCRQQAYYTATSSVESLYAKIKTNGSILNDITTALNDAYDQLNGVTPGIDVTTIRVKIGSTHGDPVTEERAVVGSDFFYTYLGECDLWARYNNAKRTEISLEAEATYNGYSETARAIIAKTNAAASELKKIFDNTFCLQSPISTIVAETTHGDIYVSQPIADTDSAGVQKLGSSYITAYNTVFAALSEGGTYNGHSGVPGQYLRYTNGDIITDENTNEGKYNKILRYGVYGNAQASTADGTLTGHTKPFDMDNSPLTAVNIDQPNESQKPTEDQLWYNDWVELYMFSAADGGTAVNGDLYADSKILIGLSDRNDSNRNYRRLWKDSVKRNVFSAVADANWTNYYLMDPEFNKLDTDAYFEHGFNEDVFFDHDGTVLTRSVSKFRLNGDMYLWEDARIENFDSYNTANSRENDIFAKKDLYIDGFYIISWVDINGKIDETATEVNVGGDVVVQGNAFISNAEIHGDVYCYGDELTIVNSIIHGNVYFTGSDFTSDTTVYNGNVVINHDGSNTSVSNYDADAGFGTTKDVGGDNNSAYRWGATITNCDIYGTLWSNVNTHLLISKWDEGGGSIPNYYGDIYVSKYLFIDLTWTYYCNFNDKRVINTYYQMDTDTAVATPEVSGHRENWLSGVNDNYREAATFNCFEYTDKNQVIYAERFQLRTNQSDAQTGKSTDVNYLGSVYVGKGGFYIDGNDDGHDERGPGGSKGEGGAYNGLSTKLEGLYTASSGVMWDVTVSDRLTDDTYWEFGMWGSESWYQHYGHNFNGENNNYTINAGFSKAKVDAGLIGYIQNGSMYRKDGSTSTSSLNFSYMHSIMPVQDNYAEKFDDPVWEDKLIKIRTWTAPKHSDDPGASTSVNYVGGETGIPYSTDASDVSGYLYHLSKNSAAGSVSGTPGNGDYTLTIKQSVCFSNRVDWSAFDRIVIDTSKGNVYIRFLNGVVLGNEEAESYDEGAEVVLTGGSMVFWYLYESGSYDFDRPTLQVNPYTRLGLVSAETGSGYGYDGLYIISNDDSLITMGQNAVLNGYVYTPYGAVYVAPAESSYTALNGCMAIESLIVLTTADEVPPGSLGDQIQDWWEDLIGGGNVTENVDSLVKQYENIVFNYVQPPLIVDFDFSYGNTEGEVNDFGQVVWEFLGYY